MLRTLKGKAPLLLILAASPLLASGTSLDTPHARGDTSAGRLHVPLFRGPVVPYELTVATTPNDCSGVIAADITWNEEDDTVKLQLKGDSVLFPHPSVNRTTGVDFFPNPFFPQPEDVVNGRYQFWIIGAGGRVITFWYSGTTLDLLGSEFDFPSGPPAGSIPVQLPTLRAVGSPFFQPDSNGNVDFVWEFSYHALTRGDRPEFAHHYVSFPPPNLCQANPFRFDQSTARPYITKPLPASEAVSFKDYLREGLIFDLTIDPPSYFVEPPLTTLIATYSGATNIGGGIPKGWTMDIDAAFMNNAPPIRTWDGAGQCQQWVKPVHTQNINFCAAQ
ncbi:MAG TPA: hypothetical protein VIV40_17910 [Kofleriaceae bacterium]